MSTRRERSRALAREAGSTHAARLVENEDAKATTSNEAGEPSRARERLTTAFGWLAGGALGLVVNYAIFLAVGEGYPTTYTTFGLFLAGAFGGMSLADHLGARGFKVLGIAAGVLLAIFVTLVLASFMGATS